MSKLIEYRTRMGDALQRLQTLNDKNTRSADEESEIDRLLSEVNDLGPKIERETTLDATARRSAEFERPAKSVAGIVTNESRSTAPKFDRRSLGQIVATGDEVQEYIKRGGKGRSQQIDVGSFYGPNRTRSLVEHSESMTPDELRTLVYGGALPTDMVMPQYVSGVFRGNEPIARLRDVLINGTTDSDAIVFFRELGFTNNSAEVAEAVSTSTGTKPESEVTFEQATAPVQTIAHWIPITRQTLQDAAQLRTYVEGRLIDGLKRREDAQLLNGNGTAPNLRGILQTSGIQSLTTGGEFTTSPVANAGTSNENFNRVRRAKTKIRVTGDATPTFVVLHPADLEQFETYSDANQQYIMGDPSAGTMVQRLWGLQVVENEYIAENTALVGDGSMAAVWDRMDATIFVADQHSDFFVKNIFVLLAEQRLALTVFRPAAFASVQLVA